MLRAFPHRRRPLVIALLLVVMLLLFAGAEWWRARHSFGPNPEIWLLLPDGVAEAEPLVQLWLDASSETGVPMRAMRASRFLRPVGPASQPRAIVMPDSVHRRASDALLSRIDAFVKRGGALLLVYDAATLRLDGTYAPVRSRLSRLAGIDYALYDDLGARATRSDRIHATPTHFEQLEVPPGKYRPEASGKNVLGAYAYAQLRYPHYATRGPYEGERIASAASSNEVIIGRRSAGAGEVVFVNIPLGYLKSQTDGMLLHGVLTWFAKEVVGLPTLLSVPDGVGGLVLNWHIDSNASYSALERLMADPTTAAAGPFSMHITAGPDAFRKGDGLGFALDTDPRAKDWVKRFVAAGHSIGSHGGWIHNEFGEGVNQYNASTFTKYLVWNNTSVSRATGTPVREYSAPNGNHPQWVTDWLEANGVRAYYFTGNSGMAPTRTYRDGIRSDRTTWAFPIVAYGDLASFEEAKLAGLPDPDVEAWLRDLVRFTSRHRSARLLYMHPPGALLYPTALPGMLQAVTEMGPRFRWYTMDQLAAFLDRRADTQWVVAGAGARTDLLKAVNPNGLKGITWTIPGTAYCRPLPRAGKVVIEAEGSDWLVHVRGGTEARIELPHALKTPATNAAMRCAANPSP